MTEQTGGAYVFRYREFYQMWKRHSGPFDSRTSATADMKAALGAYPDGQFRVVGQVKVRHCNNCSAMVLEPDASEFSSEQVAA